MDIVIKRTALEELDCAKIKIRLYQGKFKAAILSFIAAIIVTLIYIKEREVHSDDADGYLLCAIMFFSFSIQVFRFEYKKVRAFKKVSEIFVDKFATVDTFSTIKIDEAFFIYESVKKYNKLSWSSFSKYKMYKGNLILLNGQDYSTGFVIKQNEMSNAEFEEFYNFVSSTVALKK